MITQPTFSKLLGMLCVKEWMVLVESRKLTKKLGIESQSQNLF